MEKDQLISMIHFLVKREDERAQENQELKDIDLLSQISVGNKVRYLPHVYRDV